MPFDNIVPLIPSSRELAARREPSLTVVASAPRPRFRPADPGAVRLGVARLGPEIVAELLSRFEREALRTGDWSIYDDLLCARDGIVEPPPEAA